MTTIQEHATPSTRRRQRGLTAVETLLALAAGALAVLGAVVLYNSAIFASKVQDSVTQLTELQQGVRTIHMGTPGYGSGDLTPILIQARIAPEMHTTAGGLVHPFKKPVAVTGRDELFDVRFADLDPAACARVAVTQTGTPGQGLNAISINGDDQALPITVAAAAAACANPLNAITWTFQ